MKVNSPLTAVSKLVFITAMSTKTARKIQHQSNIHHVSFIAALITVLVYGMSRRMRAFYAIKLPCSDERYKDICTFPLRNHQDLAQCQYCSLLGCEALNCCTRAVVSGVGGKV